MGKRIAFFTALTVVFLSVFFIMKMLTPDVQDETVNTEEHIHTPGDEKIENEVAATCTTGGSYDKVVYCKDCNDEISRETVTSPALGHTNGEPAVENDVEPTCTTTGGYDTVVRCTVCGEVVTSEHTEEAALGHTNGEPVVENNVEATCTTAGGYDTVVRCTVCGEVVTSEHTDVSELGHTNGAATVENNVEATCTTAGSYDTVVRCTVCGEVVTSEHTDVPLAEHPFSAWTWITKSTFESGGEQQRVCVCGKTETRVTPAFTDGLDYSLNADGLGYTVTGMGTNKSKDIVIPDTHEGLPVTTIKSNAFQNKALTSVVILGGVTTIETGAFSFNDSILTIQISDSVTSIGSQAFYTFGPDLINVTVDDHNQYYKSIDGVLYTKDGTELILYHAGKADTLFIVPDGVTTIAFGALIGSSNLTSIVIPTSVTSVEAEAFDSCTKLTHVYYIGTEEEWANITVATSYNTKFINATKYYYSETQPTEAGNYWHYVDGVITEWPAV